MRHTYLNHFKSQGFRFLHPLRFLCWRFPRPLHHGNKIWKRAGDINGRGWLDLLAPQWDEMPKQTHVYSAWHPSLCVIQSQSWGTPYISHVVQMFRWFHIPSHDVQTTANLNPTRLCFKTRWITVICWGTTQSQWRAGVKDWSEAGNGWKWPLHVHMPTVLPTLSCLKFGSTIVASCYGPPIEAKCL